FGLAVAALVAQFGLPARAEDSRAALPVEISRPNAVTGCDSGLHAPGLWTLNDAADNSLAVNPTNPRNIVSAWVGGPYQNIIVGASFDGGRTWRRAPVPMTLCAGGPFLGCGDPRLSFAANGDVYVIAVIADSFDSPGVAISKSS